MPFQMPLVLGRMPIRPYLKKNIVIIKEINKYKIVYFGDSGIAINENFTRLFGLMISYQRKSKYFSLKNIHNVEIKRNGLKNYLFINGKTALTWYTVDKDSFSYQKMSKLVKACQRKMSILQLDSVN